MAGREGDRKCPHMATSWQETREGSRWKEADGWRGRKEACWAGGTGAGFTLHTDIFSNYTHTGEHACTHTPNAKRRSLTKGDPHLRRSFMPYCVILCSVSDIQLLLSTATEHAFPCALTLDTAHNMTALSQPLNLMSRHYAPYRP